MSALDHARDKRKGGSKPPPTPTPEVTASKLPPKFSVGERVSPTDRENIGTITELLPDGRYKVRLVGKNGEAEKPFPEHELKNLVTPSNRKGSGVSPAVAVPPYRPFPIHALPPAVREFVESVANSVGCDPCFAALPALTLVGAAIGGALTISPKRGWKEVPILWAVVIGDSGTAKSPAANPVSAIAQSIEDGLDQRFEIALATYIDDLATYKARQKDDASEKDPNDIRPIPPVREYFTADDVTIERLVENLKGSPRGIFLLQDELANWFGSFSRYKGKSGGCDAAKWLGMFDGQSVGYQRRTATPGTPRDIRVKRAIVSVSGGIQPGILANILSDESYMHSGLASRLVFAMPPKRCVRFSDIEPDPEAESRFHKVVHCLREMPFDPKQPVPSIRLDVMARAEFVRFHDAMAEAAEDRDGGGMAAAYPKLARIALRLAMMHYCATEAVWQTRILDHHSAFSGSLGT